MGELLKICKGKNYTKDVVKISFSFIVKSIPDVLGEDKFFPYDNEIFNVNIGEKYKFTSNYIYQSKFTIFRDENRIKFGGYAPDYNRTQDILRNKNGEFLFNLNERYNVKLEVTKYRVYIDINDGEIKDNYGNAREEIEDIVFYVRDGVEIELVDAGVSEEDLQNLPMDSTLSLFIKDGIATNYKYYHNSKEGVYFDRMNIIQNIKCTTRNSGQYNTNVEFDLITNSKKIGIEYQINDQECRDYDFRFGFLVNNERVEVPLKKTNKGDIYYDEFVVNSSLEENRLTLIFPTGFTVAVKRIVLDKGATFKKVEKKGWIYYFGDSITEGSECNDPSVAYFSKVSHYFNYNCLDQAISGRSFNDYNVLGEYEIQPDYVIIANGTNSFCMGTGEKGKSLDEMDKNMEGVIHDVKMHFPNTKIIALLPIWRSDEIGPNYTLKDTSERMRKVYERYNDIHIIDCYEYIPKDAKYFSNSVLALHPNSEGHSIYGDRLIEDLKGIIR